jgi:ATP-binding cassette, subfamily B, bacterial
MEKIKPLSRLWRLLLNEKVEITSIYFYAILSGLLQLTVPLGVQGIIGFVLGASMVTSIYVLIFIVVLSVFFVGILQINQMKIIEKIQQKIFVKYSFQFAELIPKIDLTKNDHVYLPEKINRFFDTLSLQKGLSKILLDIPLATIQISLGLILLAFYHPAFIIFDLLLLLIIFLILNYTSKNGLKTSIEESTYKYKVVAWLQEITRVIQTLKFANNNQLNLSKTDQNVTHYLQSRTAHFKVLLFQYSALVVFKVVITAIMLLVGSLLLVNQQLNIGEFIASEIVILTVIAAVEKLISSLDSAYDVVTGLEKLATFTDIPIEKTGSIPINIVNGGVEIKMNNFSFGFKGNQPILQNINLLIPAGSIVCLSGNEGAGKSVFMKFLAGNYTEYQGTVLFNGLPSFNYEISSFRSKVGVYYNESNIFQGSIWENISLNRANFDQKDTLQLAETLGIEIFMDKVEKGLETLLEPNSSKIPNSIIKKILLLRALVHQPALLLLKEPWQGFEPKIQVNILNYIFKNTNKATIIVASNDSSFAQNCQYHIQLNNGMATITKN